MNHREMLLTLTSAAFPPNWCFFVLVGWCWFFLSAQPSCLLVRHRSHSKLGAFRVPSAWIGPPFPSLPVKTTTAHPVRKMLKDLFLFFFPLWSKLPHYWARGRGNEIYGFGLCSSASHSSLNGNVLFVHGFFKKKIFFFKFLLVLGFDNSLIRGRVCLWAVGRNKSWLLCVSCCIDREGVKAIVTWRKCACSGVPLWTAKGLKCFWSPSPNSGMF